MVHGLEKFREYFLDFSEQYVLIGGSACEILFSNIDVDFRATRDLDVVLIIEALSKDFITKFWEFIKDGGYINKEKSSGSNQFYRFSNPKISAYPLMIELFSTKSDILEYKDLSTLTPLSIENEIISLSAILLNREYYKLIHIGKKNINGYSVLDFEYIVLFKIRAWLDLHRLKLSGIKVDSKNINKHKNDIFKLLTNIYGVKIISLSDIIKEDAIDFINEIEKVGVDLKSLGIKKLNLENYINQIRNIYLV
jgi:hypothetical protein